MGLNICLVRAGDWRDDPRWDSVRQDADRDFWRTFRSQSRPHPDDPELSRPSDSDALRAWVREHAPNPDRYLRLLDWLDADASLGMYGSV
jgi:hypothetical protein